MIESLLAFLFFVFFLMNLSVTLDMVTHVITFGKLRQEECCGFETSQAYVAGLYLNNAN